MSFKQGLSQTEFKKYLKKLDNRPYDHDRDKAWQSICCGDIQIMLLPSTFPFNRWENEKSLTCCICKNQTVYYRIGSKAWKKWIRTTDSNLYSKLLYN
jgi:Fe-S cluster biosynthesis and repair protein YggX